MKRYIIVIGCILLSTCTNRQVLKQDNNFPDNVSATFSNDKGESFNDAIIIEGVKNQREGVAAEQKYISTLHGERGQDWFLVGKTVIKNDNKIVDVVEIQLSEPPERKIYYFDATAFILKN